MYSTIPQTNQVMRRLKQQGELEELRDEEGPGGDALPETVRPPSFGFDSS